MKILLIYYHPIIWDFAETLMKLGYKVSVGVNLDIKDNYGTGKSILENAPQLINTIPLQIALMQIKQRSYDLVGCDGVFSGDDLVIKSCQDNKIPYFCINGYPHNIDEPSHNILSFSWFLPQMQYKRQFHNEVEIKEIDWKNISEKGHSVLQKNSLVFYPEMSYVKDLISHFSSIPKNGFTSLIHRYKECNINCWNVFESIKAQLLIESIRVSLMEGKSQNAALAVLGNSAGLLHLKHGDCPGIAVLESMLLSVPVYTMKSFVLASFNQEVLIDGYTAVVADSVDELIYQLKQGYNPELGSQACNHILQLTSIERQKNKLKNFLEKCV